MSTPPPPVDETTTAEPAPDSAVETNGRARRTKRDARLVSFSDVVRAHHRWDVAEEADQETARHDFNAKLDEFERRNHVSVVDAYWCRKDASAVALAEFRQPRPGPVRRFFQKVSRREKVPDLRLYRVTDWVTEDSRKLADLLHACDVLAIKATWGLEGLQRTVVMQWLLAVEAHILGFVESEWRRRSSSADAPETRAGNGRAQTEVARSERAAEMRKAWAKRREQQETAARLDRVYRGTLRELSKIEDYYLQAGEKRARLRYVQGMLLLGVPAVAITAVITGLILNLFFDPFELDSPGVRRFYASMGAGAIGAMFSVLIRMAGRGGGFAVDHELGSVGVMRLGAFRPLVGAVSGVVLVLLFQTNIGPMDVGTAPLAFYVVVGFLAGFSERWTVVVLGGAMRTIDKVDDKPDDGKTGAAASPGSTA